MAERDIFSELMAGMQELKDHQEGKITLKSYKVEKRAPATIAPEELRRVRENLNLSQAVLLIRMVQQNPDTLNVLAHL